MAERSTHRDTSGLAGLAVRPHLCLDFANTVASHDGASRYDHLASYADLVAWSHDRGTLTEQEAEYLHQEGARRPVESAEIFHRAIALREAIYRIFSNQVHGIAPPAADLAALNSALGAALAHARLVPAALGITWGWMAPQAALDRPLWPVATSAAALLTSAGVDKVRACAGHACAWLFVDTTKNQSRRYCTAQGCGNRARARRHYARIRAAGTTAR